MDNPFIKLQKIIDKINIKPYYRDDNGVIYNVDCLDILKQMPDNSVNLILTDPPYNIGNAEKLCKKGNNIVSNKDMWGHFEPEDNEKWFQFLDNLFTEFYRTDQGSIYLFYDRFEITKIKDMLKLKGFYPKNLLSIIKTNPLPHFRKNGFRSDFELCIFCQKEKGVDTFHFFSQEEMKSVDYYVIGKKESDHETEKPLKVFMKYIRISSDRNDIVLDPFLGGGTTAVACKNLGRYYIGIEKEKKYADMAIQRLRQEVLNL